MTITTESVIEIMNMKNTENSEEQRVVPEYDPVKVKEFKKNKRKNRLANRLRDKLKNNKKDRW